MYSRPKRSGDPLNRIISARLLAEKENRGISYPQMVKATGLSRHTVMRILSDQVAVRMGDFSKVAAALGLNPGDVLEAAEAELAKQSTDTDPTTGR